MASNNKVYVKGNLGRDPETAQSQSGTTICRFSVATNEKWNYRNTGQQQVHTEWHIIKAFGRQGEVLAQHLKAGDPIIIWGKLRTNKFQDRHGNDRQVTEIHVDEFDFVGGRQGGGQNPQPQQPPQQPPQQAPQQPPQQARPQQQVPQQPAPAGDGDDFFDDEIPF
ncbi:single-stranded DNA-binding protein [Modicisalibacter sp. MOD 31.J]|uniref:single-stranded DNA-binding protein n=1 Tax=Modicisalibacter sp. MOD 31.J TaxID=2831897 RepID=UPI001CCB6140|nr:single-stranded DNA-binding protein [Modicisalibacter sp. MOD 31.J]MBZ9574517.1 single-stranded DNA-binding protein [Modicisalibacter sp. MOD 31.J]